MSRLLILILLVLAIVNCQHHNTHADDEDDVIFPPWKLGIVLRQNGQSCYMYSDGCDFACYEDCESYNGDNADQSLAEYKRQLNQSENYLLSKKENVYLLFPSLQYEVVRLISSKSKAYDDYKTNDTLTNQIVQSFKTLKLNQNENPNEILSQLISKLANHIQIQELMILGEFQNITARGFLDLSSDLQKLDNISKVNIELSICRIHTQGARDLCIGLSKCQNLKTLMLLLSNNLIGDEDIKQGIGSGIGKLITIQTLELYLHDNSICEGGILDLGSGLSQLTYLKYLTLLLNNNKIDSEAISILTSSIDNYIYLSALILSLNSNEIRSTGLQSLADWLVKQNNISYLNLSLSGNKIDDKGSQYLSSTFSKYPKMSVLILQLRSNNIDFTLYTKTKFAILKILRLVHFQFFMDQQEYDNEEEGGG
ncbi:hypothetical protein ABPG74_005332 [Tetrahymena malaccensis]